ncbi:MAG: peptidase S10 [Acidobacteriales bacterium]|nr:peptidase S10 [Terriglobales bacterium]
MRRLLLLPALSLCLLAQAPEAKTAPPATAAAEEKPVVTKHQITAGNRTLAYTVTAGMMPIMNAAGETEADMFYMAYTLDNAGPAAKRPLMFSFNGGPGSSSVWLHVGALGPKRVKMREDGSMPAPPFELVDNEYTWLGETDLVFIDPVGTGYSRPRKADLGKKFWNVKGDIQSVGEFVRMYLTRYERWTSPLFLVGESYGTTRAAGLAGHLIDQGIAFNGIVLVSSILNFQTARFAKGNDLPYVLFLPTYTATAWYHKKLPADLQADFQKALSEAEQWAEGPYAEALARGDRLGAAQRQGVIDKLNRLTGLDKRYIAQCNLRIEIQHFCKELLRDRGRTVGRLDSRFQGIDESGVSETPDFDPTMSIIYPPYTTTFNQYVRTALGYKTDRTYNILGGVDRWEFGPGYADTSEALRSAFAKNPYMKLFVASGYFDLATPYFATQYTMSHMGLDGSLRGNVTTANYEAGHMMYLQEKSLGKLKSEVADFLVGSLGRNR